MNDEQKHFSPSPALTKLRETTELDSTSLRQILNAMILEDLQPEQITRDDWMRLVMPIMTWSGKQSGEYAAKVALGKAAIDPAYLEFSTNRSKKLREFSIGLDSGKPVKSSLREALELLDLIEQGTAHGAE